MVYKFLIGLVALYGLQCLTKADVIQDEIIVRNDLIKLLRLTFYSICILRMRFLVYIPLRAKFILQKYKWA